MNKFAIILGEPRSINSEILAKSNAVKSNCIIIGSYDLLKSQLKILNIKKKLKKIKDLSEFNRKNKSLNILDVPIKYKKPFNISPKETSKYIMKSFNIAHTLSAKGLIKGFINCPINKKKVFRKSIGVTDFLGVKNKCRHSEVMMIYNKKMSVVPITTHIKIKDVSKKLDKNKIIKKLFTLNKSYYRYFKKKPKIAVLGLNPHNYELRKDSEEKKILIPVIKKLKKKMNIFGPFPADTIFLRGNLKKFNVIVGMYHDQVLAPFKSLFGFDAVNITLGLPYLRLSPDHGVAEDKIKLKISSAYSLDKCIKIISKINF